MLPLYEENNKLLPSRDRRPPALLNKIFATTSFWSRCYKCIQFYSPLRPTQLAQQLVTHSPPRPGRPTHRRGSLSQPLFFKEVVYLENCWIKQSQKTWQRRINPSLLHYQNLSRKDGKCSHWLSTRFFSLRWLTAYLCNLLAFLSFSENRSGQDCLPGI